ncbi:MAG: hypothetical protein WAO58_09605 [Fimbriimonadaceae bacterium]
MTALELRDMPGGNLVVKGLADLGTGTRSEEAILLPVARRRLEWLGFAGPQPWSKHGLWEHELYELVEQRRPDGAHAAYNALIQLIHSFANACTQLNSQEDKP